MVRYKNVVIVHCVSQRPMVRLKVDEELCVEWRGRWMKAVVTQVDCSLVGVSVETVFYIWLRTKSHSFCCTGAICGEQNA